MFRVFGSSITIHKPKSAFLFGNAGNSTFSTGQCTTSKQELLFSAPPPQNWRHGSKQQRVWDTALPSRCKFNLAETNLIYTKAQYPKNQQPYKNSLFHTPQMSRYWYHESDNRHWRCVCTTHKSSMYELKFLGTI